MHFFPLGVPSFRGFLVTTQSLQNSVALFATIAVALHSTVDFHYHRSRKTKRYLLVLLFLLKLNLLLLLLLPLILKLTFLLILYRHLKLLKTKNPVSNETGFSKERRRTEPEGRTRRSIKKKNPSLNRLGFQRKATTYSPTNCSTICAGGLNFSVRDGKR